jgi:osmotically-inducible protein OsmY
MRLMTLLALAGVAAGIYHYRQQRGISTGRRRAATPDLRLAQQVRGAIEAAVANPGRVDVKVHRGVVALRGEVRNAERDLVLQAALGVPGVSQVTNLLETEQPVGELGTMQAGIATGV